MPSSDEGADDWRAEDLRVLVEAAEAGDAMALAAVLDVTQDPASLTTLYRRVLTSPLIAGADPAMGERTAARKARGPGPCGAGASRARAGACTGRLPRSRAFTV